MSHNRINISFNGMTLNSLNDIDGQIKRLQDVKAGIESNALDALNWYDRLGYNHKSSCYKTEELKKTYSMFKKGLKMTLTTLNNTNNNINIVKWTSNLEHFFISGFIELENNKFVYFSIEDLRGGSKFMIRSAKSFKDYTGGHNQYLDLTDFEKFKRDLTEFLNRINSGWFN